MFTNGTDGGDMTSIAIINQKGGVGKTATAANLGAALSNLGNKVLVVDMDPQADLSTSFGIMLEEDDVSIFDFLMGASPLEDVVEKIGDNLDIIPSSIGLAMAEMQLITQAGREFFLRDNLEKTGNTYDYILIDCPPSLNILTINCLAAVSDVLITIETEYLAMRGVKDLKKTISALQTRLKLPCAITGALATKYDSRKNLHKTSLDMIQESFPEVMFKTVIRTCAQIAEATAAGKTVFDHAPKCNGAVDYLALAQEVQGRSEKLGKEVVTNVG